MMTTDTADITALEPRTELAGKVVKTTLAGALIDVGLPLPGVLHISQLQKDPVNKVEDVLREGQSVVVWVRKVRKDRIELTMIRPLQYEWKDLQAEMIVKGKIVRLESYGAFIEIGAERPGMIHISELARGYVKAPGEIVKEGDEIEAKILSVDQEKRQIRLSLKALQPEIEEPVKPARESKRPARGKKREQVEEQIEAEAPAVPELTAMQMAWHSAQERAQSKGNAGHTRRQKANSSEQEEILNRTLQERVHTGA